jgi:lambda repressor-like predicted transcriptional regulator
MHPEDVKAAIRKNGSSQAAIARGLGVTPTTVNLVLYGKSTSQRVAKRIAAVSGYAPADIWPGKYERRHAA